MSFYYHVIREFKIKPNPVNFNISFSGSFKIQVLHIILKTEGIKV